MYKIIRKCVKCDTYSMDNECSVCNEKTIFPHPPKYSPDDKYVRLRLKERYYSDDSSDDSSNDSSDDSSKVTTL